jgi:hypothetical protein
MPAAPTAGPVTPIPCGQSDPLGKFTKHRRYSSPITRALMTDPDLRDLGRAIGNCSIRLGLDVPQAEGLLGEPLLRSAHLCNRRLCPFCEWRRTRVWRSRLIGGLNAAASDHPNWSAVFLTFTVRNCPVGELRQTIDQLHRSLKRLTLSPVWPSAHWLRRTEVTVSLADPCSGGPCVSRSNGGPSHETSRRIQSVHPHLHCLLLVRPSYWSRDYVKQLRWQQEWQMAARLDYAPVVDVRRAKAKPADDHLHGVAPVAAVIEAAKYATKATDLLSLGDQLPEFHRQMKGIRLYGISKGLQQYIKSAEITSAELLDTEHFPVPALIPSISAVAEWIDSAQEYRFAA